MNTIEALHQKEVSLLEVIHRNPSVSQRYLSKILGLSLGQVNSLIKNLIDKGDLQVGGRDGRRVEYIITNRGHARWIRYNRSKLSDAFHCISEVKKVVGAILDKFFEDGIREFVLEGENDVMAAIVGEVFKDIIGNEGKLLWGPAKDPKRQVVIKLDGVEAASDEQVVHLLHELAKAD